VKGRVVPSGSATHDAVQELLPWFVNHTLNADETALVREHLRSCAQCRADTERQKWICAIEPPTTAEMDVDQSFRRLLGRIEEPQSPPAPAALPRPLRQAAGAGARWLRWALAAQAAVIAMLAVLLLPASGLLPAYYGLGQSVKAEANIVVIFKPDTSEQELRQILREAGARVTDGPTAADAYLLRVDNAGQQHALGVLRSRTAVALAEPLTSGGGR
jgi:hypothetical protein